DPGGLVEREATDAGPERREGDTGGTDLAGAGHGAADGRLDDRAARASLAIERHGVDDVLGGQRAGRGDDRAAERDGRLPDGRELARVTAGPLERSTDTGRHPQRQIGRVHDRVDLQVADIAVPEL